MMRNAIRGVCGVALAGAMLFGALEMGATLLLYYGLNDAGLFRYASYRQLARAGLLDAPGGRRAVPHRYLGYVTAPDYVRGANRHNALGYRGAEIAQPKPAGEFRIACLGGSTTYTNNVEDYREAYPAQLEAVLHAHGQTHVRVVNAGVEGYTSYETLIHFALRVLELEPDLILVYDGINDLIARLVWPPEAYRGDNSGSRGPNSGTVFMPGIWDYSNLLRMLRVRLGWAAPHSALRNSLDQPPPTARGWYWSSVPNPDGISVAAMLEANPPVYFRRNLLNLAAMAQAQGVYVVFATFAHSKHFPEQPWTSPGLEAAYDEMNAVVAEAARTAGAPLFDFASVFPDDPALYVEGIHVNAAGARTKAALFAEYLLSNGLIPAGGAGAP